MDRRSSSAGGIIVLALLALPIAMCSSGRKSDADHLSLGDGNQRPANVAALPLASPQPLEEPQETQYVATQSLNQRSTPDGRVVGRLNGGDQVIVYERKGSWVRVSPAGSSARWVSSKLLCGDAGCYRPRPSSANSRSTSSPRPARSNYSDGSCPCSGSRVCVGPRGGRYCITSGGNKRYGV